MRLKALQHQQLPHTPTEVNKVDTHMNLIHDFFGGARKQAPFITFLINSSDFRKFKNEHTTNKKARIEGIFEHCDHKRRNRMDCLTSSLTVHFKRLHKICCMTDVPMSAYIYIALSGNAQSCQQRIDGGGQEV